MSLLNWKLVASRFELSWFIFLTPGITVVTASKLNIKLRAYLTKFSSLTILLILSTISNKYLGA
jgi:hypothetical protein